MDRCDVLIVGGGPAGSSCARTLRRAGADVLVLDKAKFPRDKVCAGWITPQVLAELSLEPADYAREHVIQPITGFRTGSIDSDALDIDYQQVVSYGIRRCEFDDYLLRRSGARLLPAESLQSIQRHAGRWLVNGHIETAMIVGAGGHFCPVARHLGAAVGDGEPAVTAREIEFEMTPQQRDRCPVAQERPELYFCADLQGYGWIFRKGDWLNIGLGRLDHHRLTGHTTQFLDWLQAERRLPRDMPAGMKGHAYLLYAHGRRKLYDAGVMLIGDAAGLAYPQSGEGILTAVESGKMAAQTLIEADGDYGKERLRPYTLRLAARYGPDRPGTTRLLPAALRHYLGARILGNRWLTRNLVLDRWFLHRDKKQGKETRIPRS
jgi:geranylgeranyl reductase family protein